LATRPTRCAASAKSEGDRRPSTSARPSTMASLLVVTPCLLASHDRQVASASSGNVSMLTLSPRDAALIKHGVSSTRLTTVLCGAAGVAQARYTPFCCTTARRCRRDPFRGPAAYSARLICSSTRRFSARPSAVLLLATGRSAPAPATVIIVRSTPCWIRNSRTDTARASDNSRFRLAEPVLSVCPTMVIERSSPCSCTRCSRFCRRASVPGRIAALPTSNRASPLRLTTCRSEEHTSELQSRENLVCRLLLENKNLNTSN